MFELEKAITEWRQQTLAAGIKNPAPLEELEAHLRDEIERQMKSGTSARDAFQMAIQQIGKGEMLKNEFTKVGGPSTWVERLMIGICAIFIGFIIFLTSAAVILCYTNLTNRVMASIAIFCGLVVACRWKYMVPYLPVIADTRKRLAAGAAVIVCGFSAPSFFLDIVLPRSLEDQFPAIEFWLFFLLTVLICAGIGLMLNEREREVLGMKKSRFDSPTTANS
jgi:hypothetical protein